MPHPRVRIGHPLRSSLTLVFALAPLLLGTIDFHAAYALAPEPLCGAVEVFTAAAHPLAPPHLEEAGVATYRRAWPACHRLLKSIATKTLPTVSVLWPDSHRVLPITEPPRLSPGTRSCPEYRGPPARFA